MTGNGQSRPSRSMSRCNAGNARKSSDLVPRSFTESGAFLGRASGEAMGARQDLEAAIRWVQWKYWFQGQDLFHCLGNTFKHQLLIGIRAWHLR